MKRSPDLFLHRKKDLIKLFFAITENNIAIPEKYIAISIISVAIIEKYIASPEFFVAIT